MRYFPLLYALLLLLCVGSCNVAVAQDGELQLLNLPPQAYVYVDGQFASPHDGKLQVAAGQHEFQVEGLSHDNVVAFRRRVTVEANQTQVMHLACAPVYAMQAVAPYSSNGVPIFPAGPPGPPGIPGPPGLAPDATSLSLDTAALTRLLNAELTTQLHDVERRVSWVDDRTNETKRAFYWYYSKSGPLLTGPQGMMGDHGEVGTPGNLLIIQDEAGQPFLPQLTAQLGIAQTALTLKELEARAYKRPVPWQTSRDWALPLTIHTAAFDECLEKLRQVDERIRMSFMGDEIGPPGDVGPNGPRGPAWQPAAGEGVKPVRLTKQQAQQIIAALTADKGFKERVAVLRQQEQYLAIWVAQREAQE